jgi:glutathione S-transferase
MSAATTQYATGSAMAEDSLSVHIHRVLRAPRERVFDAWTKAEQLHQWRGPEGWVVLEAQSDPRPGGQHRVVVRGMPRPSSPDDKPVEKTGASHGVYLDVVPYELIRFTWLADWAPGEESVVTVRLSDAEGGTLMEFAHEKFNRPDSANAHNMGWSSAFVRLVHYLEG